MCRPLKQTTGRFEVRYLETTLSFRGEEQHETIYTKRYRFIIVIFCIVQPPIPEVDLGFALSATSAFHNETFKLMKDTIIYIINTYGTQKIHYSVLVYGDMATTEINFGRAPPSPELLKAAIKKLPVARGTPDLAKALEEAVKMFQDGDRRPLTHTVKEIRTLTTLLPLKLFNNIFCSLKCTGSDLKEKIQLLSKSTTQ